MCSPGALAAVAHVSGVGHGARNRIAATDRARVSGSSPSSGDKAPLSQRVAKPCIVEGVLEGEFVIDGRLVDDVLMACQVA
jgi:uncharacterized heparinase superfamily protein